MKLVKEGLDDVFKAPKLGNQKIKGIPMSEYTLVQTWEDNVNGGNYTMYTDGDNNTALITRDGKEILEVEIGGGGAMNIDMIKSDVVDLLLAMLSQHGDRKN